MLTKEPRPKKTAVVAEVQERLQGSEAVIVTEYRGLKVADIAKLRRSLADVGGEYKIYKNRLVRIAAAELQLDLSDVLVGPTAIAFVSPGHDFAAVAKVVRDFARAQEMLVIKGGLLNQSIISVDDVKELAGLPSREVLLSQLAGTFAAPMLKMANALQAVPRQFAYAFQALIDKNSDSGE